MVPIFIHIIRDFPLLLFAFLLCIINLYISQDIFGFNLGIDSTTKYFLLSGYVIQLLKINL